MKKFIGCFVCFLMVVSSVHAAHAKKETAEEKKARLEQEIASGKRVYTGSYVGKDGKVYKRYCLACCVKKTAKNTKTTKEDTKKKKTKRKKNNFQYMTIDERLQSLKK